VSDLHWEPGVLTGGPLDTVFTTLRSRFDGLTIERIKVRRPTDDDNVWYLTLMPGNVEIEVDAYPGGQPPFGLDYDVRFNAPDVDSAIDKLTEWLEAPPR
jgi:hypothetical protein